MEEKSNQKTSPSEDDAEGHPIDDEFVRQVREALGHGDLQDGICVSQVPAHATRFEIVTQRIEYLTYHLDADSLPDALRLVSSGDEVPTDCEFDSEEFLCGFDGKERVPDEAFFEAVKQI